MAKSDSFFIRGKVETNGNVFAQAPIDLGAYVDALGKSVLRIHNVSVMFGSGATVPAGIPANTTEALGYQITTQSQTALVQLDDKSVVTSGRLTATAAAAAGGIAMLTTETDLAPQHFTNGYLVGVEQIYLGCNSTNAAAINISEITVVLECTVETLSQSAAMALALSQQ